MTAWSKTCQKLLRDADEQIVALNMKEISDNFVAVSKDVRAFTGNAKITSAFDKLDASLTELRELSAKLNKGMDPVLADVEKVLEQAQASMDSLAKAAADISQASNPRGPVLMRLQSVLDETERASRAIKELANDLKRNPNSILVGKEQKGTAAMKHKAKMEKFEIRNSKLEARNKNRDGNNGRAGHFRISNFEFRIFSSSPRFSLPPAPSPNP